MSSTGYITNLLSLRQGDLDEGEFARMMDRARRLKDQLDQASKELKDFLNDLEEWKDRYKHNNARLFFESARANYSAGNFQSSLNDINKAIRLNSSIYDYHYLRSQTLFRLSRFSDAEKEFMKAIEVLAWHVVQESKK